MKNNYILYLILFSVIIFRSIPINLINNVGRLLLKTNDNPEISYLTNENIKLKEEYNKLLDFKNNIKFENNYVVTNLYKNNYSFDKLLINGDDYNINDEVINEKGLIGYISKINKNYSEVEYLYNTTMPVKINNEYGKIIASDDDKNIIVSDIKDVDLNDKVYSINNTYIGNVINIKDDNLTKIITVKGINLNNLDYVIVVSR